MGSPSPHRLDAYWPYREFLRCSVSGRNGRSSGAMCQPASTLSNLLVWINDVPSKKAPRILRYLEITLKLPSYKVLTIRICNGRKDYI